MIPRRLRMQKARGSSQQVMNGIIWQSVAVSVEGELAPCKVKSECRLSGVRA